MSISITQLAQILSSIMVILSFMSLIIKPVRDRILGIKAIRDSQKCLLRSQMLSTYKANKHDKIVSQYELEDFIFCYKAYKALNGNSFIDRIYDEIKTWEVEA